jgi:pimeloyl-ACP methyl ester carboxylesterase
MIERRVATADGTLLAVRTWAGTQPVAFLLVHGLASNARMWDGVAEHLKARGYASAAVDQRGHGHSDKPDDGYDFATLSADLASVIDALGWRRAIVAGQSWGANVALELAVRHPDKVVAVACVDGGTMDLGARFATWEQCARALTPPSTAGMAAVDLEAMMRASHTDWPESGILGALANFDHRDDGTVAPWLSIAHHLSILHHMWEQRPIELYTELKQPVLLVPAANAAAPREWAESKRADVAGAQAALATARTRWFDPADHDIHAQFPAELADTLASCVDDGFFS